MSKKLDKEMQKEIRVFLKDASKGRYSGELVILRVKYYIRNYLDEFIEVVGL